MNLVPLPEVATILMGQSPPSSTYNKVGNGLPFFQGKADFGALYPSVRMFCSEPARIAEAGDILLSVRAPVGPTNIAPARACIGRGLAAIRARKDLDFWYLFYFLRFYEPVLAGAGVGSTFDAVSRDDLDAIQVPLLPLDEQHRIAAILSRADRVRRLARYALELGEGYLQSVFMKIFGDPASNPKGWDKVTVDDIKANQKYACVGGPFGSNLTTEHYVGSPGVPVIRGTNLSGNDVPFHDNDFVFVSEAKADSLIQNMAHPGDLIFTQRGTLGQVGYIPEDASFDRYVISQSQMKLTPDSSSCDVRYLYHFFLSRYSQNNIINRALVTGVPHINLSILKELPVLLPALAVQQQFAAMAHRFERVRAQQREQLRQAEHLFASLLDRAFQGDL